MLSLAACRGTPGPLIPEPLAAVPWDSAAAWTAATAPHAPVAIQFKWRYRDDRVRGGGRATIRIAPPDSLRLDYRATLGLASGAGVIIGDAVSWADPAKDFHSLVPAIPMLWAVLGVVRPPVAGATASGSRAPGGDDVEWLWRFATPADTLSYRVRTGPRGGTVGGEWRRGAAVVARSSAQFDATGRPTGGRVDLPESGAWFEFTVVAVDTGDAARLDPRLWRVRR